MKGVHHPRTDVSYFPTEAFQRTYGEQEALEQAQKVKAGTWEMRLPQAPSPPEPPKMVRTTVPTPTNSDTEEQKDEEKKPVPVEVQKDWAEKVVKDFSEPQSELSPVELIIGGIVLGIFFLGIYKGTKEIVEWLSGATSM